MANEAIETAQVAEEKVDTTVTDEPVATSPYADLLDDIDSEDKEVLKRLIYHECRGKGGEAVAEVVLNRMQDGRFPDALQGIVYAPGQFTPASFLFSADINEPGSFEECGRIINEVLDPNYQRTIPANYVYFNSIGPGSSDYEWRGGVTYSTLDKFITWEASWPRVQTATRQPGRTNAAFFLPLKISIISP